MALGFLSRYRLGDQPSPNWNQKINFSATALSWWHLSVGGIVLSSAHILSVSSSTLGNNMKAVGIWMGLLLWRWLLLIWGSKTQPWLGLSVLCSIEIWFGNMNHPERGLQAAIFLLSGGIFVLYAATLLWEWVSTSDPGRLAGSGLMSTWIGKQLEIPVPWGHLTSVECKPGPSDKPGWSQEGHAPIIKKKKKAKICFFTDNYVQVVDNLGQKKKQQKNDVLPIKKQLN